MSTKPLTMILAGVLLSSAFCLAHAAVAQTPAFGVLSDIAWRPIDGHAYAVTSSGDVFANPGYCGQWAWAAKLPAGEVPVRILDGDLDGELTIGCISGTFYSISGSLPLVTLTACSSVVGIALGQIVDAAWRSGGGAYVVTTAGEILASPGRCGPWALVGNMPVGEVPVCLLDGDISASIDIGCRSGNFYAVIGSVPSVETSFCSSLQGVMQGDLVDIAWRRADHHAYAVTSTGGIYSNPGSCGAWNFSGSLPVGEQPACVLGGDVGGSMDIGCKSGNAFTIVGAATNVATIYCSGLQGAPTAVRGSTWGKLKVRYRY